MVNNSGEIHLFNLVTNLQKQKETIHLGIIGKGYSDSSKDMNIGLDQGDRFGKSVAINQSGDLLAVGLTYADGSNNNYSSSGEVHLFTFSDSNFSNGQRVAKIGLGMTGGKNMSISDLGNWDTLGSSVSLTPDGLKLAIGAGTQEGPNNVTSAGAVYLFEFADHNWTGGNLISTIGDGYTGGKNLSINLDSSDQFGSGIALSSDARRLIIGAALADGKNNLTSKSGEVRIISFSDSNFSEGTVTNKMGKGYTNYENGQVDVSYLTEDSKFGSGEIAIFNNFFAVPSNNSVSIYQTKEDGDIELVTNISSPMPDIGFGSSLVMNDEILAIGANKEDVNGKLDAGTVYIFPVNEILPNQAPYFQSDGNLSVLENETFVFEFNASDLDNDALSYAIEYGEDAQFFDLNESNGILTFLTPRDYENAEDNDSDNVYELTISVSDGNESAVLNLYVSVDDVFENQAPYFQSDGNLSVLENETFVFEFNASDPDHDALSYAIEYGDDAQFFDLNESNGILTFLNPRDYENAEDNDSDNVYELTISVSDGNESAILNLYVSVDDVFENQAPYFQSDGNLSVLENETFVFEFNASDPDHDALSYAIEYGDDAQFFDLNESNGILTFLTPRDYENAEDNDSDNVYELTISVTDGEANATLNVYVGIQDIDDTAPVITLLGDANITHEAGPEYIDVGARWNDSVDGNGTADANGTVNHLVPGTYLITYSYTDSSGNTAQQVVRTVNVVDTTPPVITLIGDANVTHSASTIYIDQGATWTDIVDGNGTADANGSVNSDDPGIYQITYFATDSAGNEAEPVVRTIHVVDSDAPVITLLGDANITHEAGPEYVDAGARWNDSVDGNGTADANSTVDHFVPGTYLITYSYTDSSGNTAQQVVRTVNVVDTKPPVITLIGDANVTHSASTIYIDQGATWTDIVDGNGTADANGSVNSDDPGIYQITYFATDSAGNEAEPMVRTIHVVDSDAPVITLLGDANITHEAGPEYVDAGARWNDSVDGNGTADTNGTVNHLVPGTYLIRYSYTDSSGNNAQQVVRTVNVVDTTPPVITLIGDANVTHLASTTYIDQEQHGRTLSMAMARPMRTVRWIPTHREFITSFIPRPISMVMPQNRSFV